MDLYLSALISMALMGCQAPKQSSNYSRAWKPSNQSAPKNESRPDLEVEIEDIHSPSPLKPYPEELGDVTTNKCYLHASLAFATALGLPTKWLEKVETKFEEKNIASTFELYKQQLAEALEQKENSSNHISCHDKLGPLRRLATRFALYRESNKESAEKSPKEKAETQQDAPDFFWQTLLLDFFNLQGEPPSKEELGVTVTSEVPEFPLENQYVLYNRNKGLRTYLETPPEPHKDPMYVKKFKQSMKAFMAHWGTEEQGHWVTYIRHQNKWFLVNDFRVSEAEETVVEMDLENASLILLERLKEAEHTILKRENRTNPLMQLRDRLKSMASSYDFLGGETFHI
jgi:hypothetical protein